MKTQVLTFPYKPHGIQWDYFNLDTRFIVAVVGRQWGKSMTTMIKAVKRAEPGGIYWWVEPTINQAKIHYRRMLKYFKDWVEYSHKTDRIIRLKTGAEFHFKGADNPENLEGETLNGVVLDEAAKLKEEVWYATIRPMLAVHGGWAMLIGKPRGTNWFKKVYDLSVDSDEWSRFQAPSDTSPFFSTEELEEARRTTPDLLFRQEYLAEFVDSAGAVFRSFGHLCTAELSEPRAGYKYYAGIDLARTTDYTVVIILDHNKNMVAYDRFNNVTWRLAIERIAKLCKKYDAQALVDNTGVGDPVFEELVSAGIKAAGYKFDNRSKRILIEDLVLTFEREEIKIADIAQLRHELTIFECEVTAAGNIRYNAPDGEHDDTVIALALANYYCVGKSSGIISSGGDRLTAKGP